ncbi:lipopolysaccharide heptosyltransferase I [Simkania sp.]|uniref:lipopolysaccharide heptosyltransferase I n=1 Tax=Simkania sp. TaxID=34094 RepID=UPI003B524FFB
MKILIVKTSALGDVIQCFPALDFLKSLLPDAEIDWVVEKPFAELLKAHPYVHHVYEVETKKWKHSPLRVQHWKAAYSAFKKLREKPYDLAIDFQGNLKSGLMIGSTKSREKVGYSRATAPEWPNSFFISRKVEVDRSMPIAKQYLTLAAASFPDRPVMGSSYVKLRVTEDEHEWIEEQLCHGKKMMICPGSNWENKKLSRETWEAFLQKIAKEYDPTFYFVWGTPVEKREVEDLKRVVPGVVLPRMSLPVWQQMMDCMEVVLSVDSSALHLAATTKARTYSFFGPSSPQVYKPEGKQHGYFQGSCPYGQSFTKRCPKLRSCSSGACLKSAFADDMYDAFSKWYSTN